MAGAFAAGLRVAMIARAPRQNADQRGACNSLTRNGTWLNQREAAEVTAALGHDRASKPVTHWLGWSIWAVILTGAACSALIGVLHLLRWNSVVPGWLAGVVQ
ncbi:hypothetical protein [Paracoccus shanxieyensis]|uniref:Uncharacterized protein n=1 Tax=Paracoccus shanxieyensis TaxID=2675752 RepID=A0A6L6IX24_9RHOB|nr:hypothetical protein [Paracoccus shanxieyensis]MTH64181.1 hypothetical protein [Paracoccus shanxieyensis]MTH87325.1 hypothetical protein [Paracoccus shanxieyensis]